MANSFPKTGDELIAAVNADTASASNDSVYLQNDIALTSDQVLNLNAPTTSGTLRLRGGTPAGFDGNGTAVNGAPANPINYRLTVLNNLTISDTSPTTDQPSFAIGPLTLQIGNGTTAGGISGNLRLDDGGVLAFNRSVDTTYTGTVSVEDSPNGIRNDVAGTTVTLTGAAGTPNGTAIRASQGTGTADAYSLRLGGAGNGLISGVIADGGNNGALTKGDAGTWTFTGVNTYRGGTTIEGGNLVLGNAAAAGTGAITFAPLSGTATARLTLTQSAQPTSVAFGNIITNFGAGSQLDLQGLSNANLSFNSTNSILTVTGTSGGNQVTQQYAFSNPSSTTFAAQNDGNGGTLIVVCFTTGTRIRTRRGEVAVEDLQIGDTAVTASGGLRPITWIGSRAIEAESGALPFHQQPVRVSAGAFGHGLPVRDLLLSPGHPVLVGADADNEGGVLVPVMCLINGTTVVRAPCASVTYWHVELDAHDILLAEGLPAESYIDGGDRAFFAQASDHALHNPDFVTPGWNGRCRPVAVEGPLVEAERIRLDSVFAGALSDHCAWDAQSVWFAA